ncbi:M61 family metallopeptidase [Moraxella oblonga]|uniref:M61 family metallopeptidase n=1 Tax=Moraxella oblonga TaxID=200413 RepID=UPI0008296BD3|nr:PDZ domain-containing protein [Moraxella oblonga]
MAIINHHLDFGRYYAHLVDVRMTFVAPCDAPTLWLPTWIAGSYLIREFSKHITTVYYDKDGTQRAIKTDKNHYVLENVKSGDEVVVHYEVYCHDLSVRTAFVDDGRIFGNFTSLLLMVQGLEQAPCQIDMTIPKRFLAKNPNTILASGLKHTQHRDDEGLRIEFESLPAFECYDYPFEIGRQAFFKFGVKCGDTFINHRFFIAGLHSTALTRLSQDVQKICQAYVDWLGDTPFDEYTFMTMVTGSEYGGLEHINSTALITPRSDLPTALDEHTEVPNEHYQRFLGLCSHEYFHAWWVKSVRPDVMITSDLQHEAYTPLLWVFEGFTSYIDDLMLLKSGVIDNSSYFKLLQNQINRYLQTDGKKHQSVAESSFDTWIKLYRPDENTTNQSVSYYNKGALVALCLDLTLLKHSDGRHRLFDVVLAFYQKSQQADNRRFGITTQTLGEVIAGMVGDEVWQDFYEKYVIGVHPLPVLEMLAEFGLVFVKKSQQKIWGMDTKEGEGGLTITHLHREGMASRAGLSVGDVLVAVNGIKASKDVIVQAHQLQGFDHYAVIVHAFRRDELRVFEVIDENVVCHEQLTGWLYDTTNKQQGWLF